MRKHHIFLLLLFALRLWPDAAARAGEGEGAPPPPPAMHHEYHNSTVYNGDVYTSSTAPGSNGFAGTWRDPETGDIITSVIAPRQPLPQEQSAPIIVAPQLYPGGGQSPYPPGGGVRPPYEPGPPPRPYPTPPPGFQPGRPGVTPPGQSMPGWRPPHPPGPPPRPYPVPPPGFQPGWRPTVPPHPGVPPALGAGGR